MTRRKTLAIAGVAVALALAAAVGVVVALRGSSFERRLEQVREGMTYDEVVAMIGNHDVGRLETYAPCFMAVWKNRRGHVWVHFDGDERVIRKDFTPIEPTGFLDRVLAWFGI